MSYRLFRSIRDIRNADFRTRGLPAAGEDPEDRTPEAVAVCHRGQSHGAGRRRRHGTPPKAKAAGRLVIHRAGTFLNMAFHRCRQPHRQASAAGSLSGGKPQRVPCGTAGANPEAGQRSNTPDPDPESGAAAGAAGALRAGNGRPPRNCGSPPASPQCRPAQPASRSLDCVPGSSWSRL